MTDRDVARWVGNLLAIIICALIIPWVALGRIIWGKR